MTPNLTAFTGVDSQNLLDVMVSVQFILAIGDYFYDFKFFYILVPLRIIISRLTELDTNKR
ncbi:hypothetical protein EFR29_04270 [Lactobacillus delbrueckii subsp. lactis]|nr:hypothetical protein [Lactobacillus delbrueckii subsp. lactis]MCT3519711.1 hypothetical protein [Lactobacillus delbrueckii subsp. lactis]